MLMEIVICLHAQVSAEYPDETAAAHIMRLWGTRVTKPPRSFLRCSLEGSSSAGELELASNLVVWVGCGCCDSE